MSLCLAITTYNRSHLLAKSLARISELTLPDEIIVVDDGSDDGCEQVCASAPVPVRYIYTHQPYQSMCSHARNIALKATDCEWFTHSEPEMFWETDVVAQFLARHAVEPDSMINAGTIHHEHPDWDPPQTTTTRNWHATWIAFYGRQWLLDIGGWDEQWPQPWGWDDVDLTTRLFATGHGCCIDQDIVATHMWHPPSHMADQGPNERHFKAKMDSDRCMQVVANEGFEWGVVKPR